MTIKLQIPVIDLAGFEGVERENLCKEIARACEQWGFFQVINHAVDESLMTRALDVYREFYYLPPEEKMKVLLTGGSRDGWQHPTLTEPSDNSQIVKNVVGPSSPEFLDNIWIPDLPQSRHKRPTSPCSFQPTVSEFVMAAKSLHEKLLKMMSEGLGLESDAFMKHLSAPYVSTRSHFYPFPATGTDVDGPYLAHSDASILSNGKYKSVLHRGSRNASKERVSLACFYSPSGAAVMAPIEELHIGGQRPNYRAVRFRDYVKDHVQSLMANGNIRRWDWNCSNLKSYLATLLQYPDCVISVSVEKSPVGGASREAEWSS
ncbi:hypothetical protein R1flu_018573 [Riccia fluitans]|uniref:Uncharacterized protein n=1 Tax=Riccia fluitans TaxID=41844 RepID=A0ABD1ZG82_9MARC